MRSSDGEVRIYYCYHSLFSFLRGGIFLPGATYDVLTWEVCQFPPIFARGMSSKAGDTVFRQPHLVLKYDIPESIFELLQAILRHFLLIFIALFRANLFQTAGIKKNSI